MPRGMKRDADPVQFNGFPIRLSSDLGIGTNPKSKQPFAGFRSEILATTGSGVVRVSMSDHRSRDRPPWIDVKTPDRAAKAVVCQGHKGFGHVLISGHCIISVKMGWSLTLWSFSLQMVDIPLNPRLAATMRIVRMMGSTEMTRFSLRSG